jgi:phenylalanine-4-hydroxylase
MTGLKIIKGGCVVKNKKVSTYHAKPVDAHGNVHYDHDENKVWHELITRQLPLVNRYACPEYLHGLELLNLSHEHIPQCHEVSRVLQATTGWTLEPVPALIPFEQFFNLLANRKFPAATFIRRRDELDYLQEPDIFHEVFGHSPLLTHKAYADFTQLYGQLGLNASREDRVMLAKLYWFTIEFGLIKTKQGLKIYGGGILSSKNETLYCIESVNAKRYPFDALTILRTPYRIDIMQPVYFYIDSFDTIFDLLNMDLMSLIKEARELGMYEPSYAE